MKKLLVNLVLLTLISIHFSGCDLFGKKGEPKPKTELEKLPAATQEGKNTFGCLVNGKAWVPVTSIDAGAVYQLGNLQIYGNLYSPTRWVSLVLIENGSLIDAQEYSLTNYPYSYSDAFITITDTSFCIYEPENTFSGKINITKVDRINYVVSGLFEFSTVVNGCDTLRITDGRFDIRYIP